MDRQDIGLLFDYLNILIWDQCAPGYNGSATFMRQRALTDMIELAIGHVGVEVAAWNVTDPKWDGIGQLIYACNMVWRNNNDGWRIVAETALALLKLS